MKFEDVLEQTIDILRRRGQVSYRALKRQFEIDDEYLADLRYELIEVLKFAIDHDQTILVWNAEQNYVSSLAQSDASLETFNPKINRNNQPAPWLKTEAERRQLTVMFCDLVESSQLAEKLDPEDLRDVFLAYQELCANAIASAEGYIARYLGDGVLIYFGYPQAHEDDARRAVSSGLRILEALKRLNPKMMKKWGERLSIRIGIHTGLVIIGEMGVKEAPDPMAIVGETPNIAARLQSVAQPNTLVISAATHNLVKGFFEYQTLEKQQLKGISKPMSVFQVVRESTAKNRFEVAEKSGLTPFVNRTSETALLSQTWDAVIAGQTRAILLQGEAGMGKSRLVWEIKKNIIQSQEVWLTDVQGSPYYRNSAFYPITELLKRFTFKFAQEDTDAEKLVKIELFLTQFSLALEKFVPLFASVLSIPFEAKYPPLNLTPERQKQKTIEAFMEVCLVIAARQPVLLVIEDLHWMDASTLDVISYFLEHIRDHRLLMLLTCRPEFTSPWPDHPHLHFLKLNSLGQKEIQVLVEQTAQERLLPGAVIQQIVQKTDGIPLFVEELTKNVLESDVADLAFPQRLGNEAAVSLAIPTSLHDSLIERLDRLSVVKEVAQLSATLGREFDYEFLEEVSQWNQATLRNGLNQLVEAGLLYQEGTPPFASYQFKHALIQDAAYQSLVKIRRQFYHQRIADTLERHQDDQRLTRPELLAYHFTEAGLFQQAIEYWLQAGQRDLEQAANSEAISHLIRGLELLDDIPEGHQRDQLELKIQLGLAPAYMAINGWAAQEVEHTCLRAQELSEKVGDPQSLSGALWGLWTNYFLRGQLDPAKDTALQVYQLATETDQRLLRIIACHAVGYTNHSRGEYEDSKTYAEQGIALYQADIENAIVRMFQFSSTIAMRMFSATSLWMLGYPEQASRQIEQAFVLVRDLDHTPSTAYALALGCFFHHYLRDFQWVKQQSERLLQLSLDEGFLLWPSFATTLHGWALVNEGNLEQGLVEMQQGIESFAQTNSAINYPHMIAMLAEGLIKTGQLTDALDALEKGIQQAVARNEHHMEPELYRLKAEVFLQQAIAVEGAHQSLLLKQAEESYGDAIGIAQRQQALMLEVRATVGLSQLQQMQGRRQEAYSLLNNVYRQCSEGWDSPDLLRARAALDDLALCLHIE